LGHFWEWLNLGAIVGSSQQSTVASFIAPAAGAVLPAGTILIFDRATAGDSVPSGWSLYTTQGGSSIVGYMIKGATSVSRVTGTPGTVALATTHTLATAGSHSLLSQWSKGGNPNTNLTDSAPGTPVSGSHAHDLVLNIFPNPPARIYPSLVTQPAPGTTNAPEGVQGVQAPLIQATNDSNTIPANCIIFSGTSSIFSGFSRKTWATVSTGVYSVSVDVNTFRPSPRSFPAFTSGGFTTSVGGAHKHSWPPNQGAVTPPVSAPPGSTLKPTDSGPVGHQHPVTILDTPTNMGVWQQFKHLLPQSSASAETVVSGMIVMFNGVSAPAGWKVCDGTNDTPDMVDYFLGYNDSESSSDVLVGTNTVGRQFSTSTTPAAPPTVYNSSGWEVSIGTATWPHNHQPSTTQRIPLSFTVTHTTTTAPHTHTITPNIAGVTLPSSFLPAHISLIFIQKE
jgi:hypothetical protein